MVMSYVVVAGSRVSVAIQSTWLLITGLAAVFVVLSGYYIGEIKKLFPVLIFSFSKVIIIKIMY